MSLTFKLIKKYDLRKLNILLAFRREVALKPRITNILLGSQLLNHSNRFGRIALQLCPFVISFPFVVNAWGTKDANTEQKLILESADRLFDESKFDELYVVLKSQPSWYDNANVLWRLARCEFHLYKSNSKQELLDEAYENVLKSLEIDNECGAAHKWAAILLDAVSTLKGTKERIKQLLTIKEHMEKAIEFDGKDPTARFLLGQWHYSCNQVSWVERNIAAVIYGSLPDSSLELALKHLEDAEQIETDFYSKNKVLIAKTLIALKRDIPKSKSLLIDVINKYKTSQKWDDVEAVKEAAQTLKSLGVKLNDNYQVIE